MAKTRSIQLKKPPQNTVAECDGTLGMYLRAWDQVDARLVLLFSKLLGTHQNATLILLRAGITQPIQRTILAAASKIRTSETEQEELTRLLERWKRASTKRNRIVHGYWLLIVVSKTGESHWVRFYPPADPVLVNKILTNQDAKARAAHLFNLKQIKSSATVVRKLAHDLGEFTDQIQPIPFVTPQRIETPE